MIYEIETIQCNQTYYILRVIQTQSKPAIIMTCSREEITNYINSIHDNNKEQFKEKVIIIEKLSTCLLYHKT